ncbi:MAG: RNA polymerase sigma factor, partial [Armatimonadota bacterium]
QQLHSLDAPDDPTGQRARARATPTPTTGASLQALIARLVVAANLVNRKHREVARLYLWGYNTAEIADMLDIPRSTVLPRWRDARTHLQQALREMSLSEWLALPTPSERIRRAQIRSTFAEDEARVLYHPPQHCPRGHEHCATTGVCAFRGVVEQ